MEDRQYLVLSAVGADRPGLVALLTSFIAQRGANVEDSRMALLGGAFGVMMLISGTDHALTAVEEAAPEMESASGMRLHFEPTSAPRAAADVRPEQIVVEAADREGIVHAVAGLLAGLGGNISSLESTLYPAPVSGAPLFRLDLAVDVPATVSRGELRRKLDELAAREDLDVVLADG